MTTKKKKVAKKEKHTMGPLTSVFLMGWILGNKMREL